jgi:hypothetical protein
VIGLSPFRLSQNLLTLPESICRLPRLVVSRVAQW